MSTKPTPRARYVVPLVGGAACALALALLLERSLMRGSAQSFDPMLYGRSLWGLAHGRAFNPVFGVHAFAIHAQIVLWLLAPFARLTSATHVLIAAQSLAGGATVALVLAAVDRGATERFARAEAFALCVLGSPVFVNPFLFDVHPETLGVPLLCAGLLRAQARDGFDGGAMLLCFAALLAREDYALALAPALLLAPSRAGGRWDAKLTRALLAALALALWGGYVLAVRPRLGGAIATEHYRTLPGSLLAATEARYAGLASLLRYKGEMLMLVVGAFGGYAVRAPRWLAAAVPAALLLFGINRILPQVGSFHYGIFAAPLLLVAGVAGRAQRTTPRRRGIGLALALALFATSSALPGGGRFRASFFAFSSAARSARAHRALERVPPGLPVSVPWAYGAPFVDRDDIRCSEALAREPQSLGPLRWVALRPPEYGSLGRLLVGREGFRLSARTPELAVLTRERAAWASWSALELDAGPCAANAARLGPFTLCAFGVAGERVAAILRRDDSPVDPETVLLLAVPGEPPIPVEIVSGLVPLEAMPVGAVTTLTAAHDTRARRGQIVLVRLGRGPIAPPVAVRW